MDSRMSFDRAEDSTGGDWICPRCQNKNFARRAVCFNCGGARGAGPEKPKQVINELFKPPSYNESSPFFQAIEKAKAEGKWILVNIQQAEQFVSHALNRDIWSDETVEDLVQGNFIFWQRDNLSTEGEQFCKNYKCSQLPHICIVDPRTGRSMKAWEGKKWMPAHTAAEVIFEFMDRHPAPTSGPAAPPPAQATPAAPSAPPVATPAASAAVGTSAAAPPATVSPPAQPAQPAQPENPAMPTSGGHVLSEASAPAAGAAAPAEEEGTVAAMPEEPGTDAEHVKVSFKLPSGQRTTKRLRLTDTLEVLFAVASALAAAPPGTLDVSLQFPKRSLRDVEGGMAATVKDAKVAGNLLLVETGKRRREG